jgi:hypothetical protein
MSDPISLIANISLALTFLAGLIFGIIQTKQAGRDRRERLTLETLRAFQTREFVELMHFVGSDRFPKNYEAFRTLTGTDFEMLLQFSQQMESLGILVADGLVDIDLVDKTLGTYVTTTWNKYKVFMVPARERDPYLSEYFQWLAERMEERQKATPRVPFYKYSENQVRYKR